MKGTAMHRDTALIHTAIACKCPKCGKGDLFKPGRFHAAVNPTCASCGFALGNHDSADGPAVLLIFVLGALLLPLALVMEFGMHAPLWIQVIVLVGLLFGSIIATLRPLKAYVIALQVKHRPEDMNNP